GLLRPAPERPRGLRAGVRRHAADLGAGRPGPARRHRLLPGRGANAPLARRRLRAVGRGRRGRPRAGMGLRALRPRR
ncbi:MAG: hypothetical protein AVDCRST_MAG30-3089, partial [uncultured Solirubrobacteraceae bacterium]